MMNRLAEATSPYLRQHADNPVDWWPWSPQAFEEARRRDVPIHLSIGYAACHWCHVMARESFSDPEIAALLNRDFVSIKVDREERPEVDQIYMRALHALGEQGGWPLTMFLTPDAKPFWGGTYFPPEPRWGRPGFPQILNAVSSAWQAQDAAVTQNASALLDHLNRRPLRASSPEPRNHRSRRRHDPSVWDPHRGSFKGAPKFPNAAALDVLWRAYMRTGDAGFRTAVLNTLTFVCQGGIYDHLGGGFARYSVDAEWKVPHFEKMLYDNGQLLWLLALACRETKDPLFRSRIDETVGWLTREMQLPGGGLASSVDADTEHEEGLTYTWTWPELQAVLGDEAEAFVSVYDASVEGNWEGKNILNRLPAASRGWLGDERERRLQAQRERLMAVRNRRPQPARDDKVLADWNGLAISGLAQAARAIDGAEARNAAHAAFRFVTESMADGDRLAHSSMGGTLVGPGLATDYANMVRAALDLFALDGDAGYLERAETWFRAADAHHFDPELGAYNLAADDAPPLIAKPLSISDEATPAATGIMAANAATLFMLTAKDEYRARAEHILGNLSARAGEDIVGSASLQAGYDTFLRARTALIIGERENVAALLAASLSEADPALFIANPESASVRPGHPAHGKSPTKANAGLFLWDAFRCLPEIAASEEATETLRRTRSGLA
jgi:uncharacterized protein YyaL (SSP411 family)